MPDPATGGTLHDTIARCEFQFGTGDAWSDEVDVPIREFYERRANAILVALKEHLAEHPAALREIGWTYFGTIGWGDPQHLYYPPAPASQDVGAERASQISELGELQQ